MEHVLTLVSDSLTDGLVRAAGTVLERNDAAVGEPRWLAGGVACDLPFGGLDPLRAETRVRGTLNGAAVDLAAMPTEGRRKRLLVADMESTIIANEMLDELGEFVGQRLEIENITARAMRGEIDFEGAVHRRVALLKGLRTEVLERSLERITINPGASNLVATMAAGGAYSGLVSGGFSIFVEPIAHRLGFNAWRANEIELKDGALTGKVVEPILGLDAKIQALKDYCGEHSLAPNDAIAVGDGANDLGMLQAAGLGVAYHAKPTVAAEARFRVNHGDLRTLLYFQGYSEAEIVG